METGCISSSSRQPSEAEELVDLEFDGNTVLCRVCGDRASGFHYGVHACEGCKGFFRRSIQQKIQYRPCLKNQLCLITRINRNRCQYCRLKKCIAVGMSRDAVRFGRVPKREKAKIMEQMQKVNTQCHGSTLDALLVNESEFRRQIVDVHMKTCHFTRSNFERFYREAWSRQDVVHCPAHMACPLNPFPDAQDGAHRWDQFSDCFMPAIRNVVTFAKGIPGFSVLGQEDQVTLLKAGTFEVLLVHLACLFDSKNGTMFFTNGKIFKRTSISFNAGAGYLLDSMFDFSERFNELNLTDEEVALFSSLVLISSDRPGLRGVDLVEKLQSSVTRSLQTYMKANHTGDPSVFAKLLVKISELRMLNTVHSEKLLGLAVPVVDSHGPVFRGPSRHGASNPVPFCFVGGGEGGDCPLKNPVDSRGRTFDLSDRFDNESICNSLNGGGGAIDLRGGASCMVGRGSSWHVESRDGESRVFKRGRRVCDNEFGGCVRSDDRQFLRNPGHIENDWSTIERTKRSEVVGGEKTSSLPRPPSLTCDLSAGSSVAHRPSGASIVAHQVMLKNSVRQELILTTPVGTFHRTPLNFWSMACSNATTTTTMTTLGNGSHRRSSTEDFGAENGECQTWKRRKQMELCRKKTSEKSVISTKKQVMRTWSDDTNSSKQPSPGCYSNSDTSAESFPVKSDVASAENADVDVLRIDSPTTPLPPTHDNDKTDENRLNLSTLDLPILKRALSTCRFCPSSRVVAGRSFLRDTVSSCRSSSADSRDVGAPRSAASGREDGSGDRLRSPFCGTIGRDETDRGQRLDDDYYDDDDDDDKEMKVRRSWSSLVGLHADGHQGRLQSQSLSGFVAENLLRMNNGNSSNNNNNNNSNRAVVDQAAALPSTISILKDRLLRRIDSRDNVEAVVVVPDHDDASSATTGVDRRVAPTDTTSLFPGGDPPIVLPPSSSSSYPLSFLADYPRYYPPPLGLHPGLQLYNRLAFQHLHHAIQHQHQQQQQLQVQVQQARLNHTVSGLLPIGDGVGAKSIIGAVGFSTVWSTGSENLGIDGSSDFEEIKHLNNMQPENLTQKSPVLVKSELT